MSDDGADTEIPPNATVYVRNLEERVKIPELVEALRGVFAEFGTILDIIAKKSIKRKGQAFVVFDEIDSAQNAIDDLNGFELFGRHMHLDFAKTRSDITVKQEDGDDALNIHMQQRLAEKERKKALEHAKVVDAISRKRALEDDNEDESDVKARPAKAPKLSASLKNHVPDEYLPPNSVLTVAGVPADVTRDDIVAALGHFPGFKEPRLVPGREVAFVEFVDIDSATNAKQNATDIEVRGHSVKISYRRVQG